jgi:serine/threonine protein phosphatase PrpC
MQQTPIPTRHSDHSSQFSLYTDAVLRCVCLLQVNQDVAAVAHPFARRAGEALFCVLDGHGQCGREVSQEASKLIGSNGNGLRRCAAAGWYARGTRT